MGQIAVGKTVFFGPRQERLRQVPAPVLQNLLFQFHQFLHLLNKPGFDKGLGIEGIDAGALAQRLIHDELALAGGLVQEIQEFIQGFLMKILGEPQAVAADLQRPDGFLEGLFIGLADDS